MKKRTQNYYLYMYMSMLDAMLACGLCLIHIKESLSEKLLWLVMLSTITALMTFL